MVHHPGRERVVGSIEEGGWPGLSRRDWFAGQALIGLLACPTDVDIPGIGSPQDVGYERVAFGLADRMLGASKERPKSTVSSP